MKKMNNSRVDLRSGNDLTFLVRFITCMEAMFCAHMSLCIINKRHVLNLMLSLLSRRSLRPLALSRATRLLSTRVTFEEPSRPGLFYHLVHAETRPLFAVSLLDAVPQSAQSATVIGLLPASTEDGASEADATFNDFVPNRSCVSSRALYSA